MLGFRFWFVAKTLKIDRKHIAAAPKIRIVIHAALLNRAPSLEKLNCPNYLATLLELLEACLQALSLLIFDRFTRLVEKSRNKCTGILKKQFMHI